MIRINGMISGNVFFFSVVLRLHSLLRQNSRSLELNVDNAAERAEALKLSGLMLRYNSEQTTVARDVVASRMAGSGRSDSLFPRNILRTVKQAVLSPDLILDTLGAGLLWDVEESVSVVIGWLAELLSGAVLNERPSSFEIFAPVIEIGLSQRMDLKELRQQQLQPLGTSALQCISKTLLNLLRTWPGLFACSAPDEKQNTVLSSLLRFVDITALSRNVNLRRHEVCDALIDCFCELLDLSYASHNFRSWPEAVKFYSTMHHPDAYKCSLRDEFVLAEHEVLLRAKEHDSILSDLLVSFRAVATYMLVSAGIIQVA
ncbi:unnamed protein product [Gongylonema pulchrum]|uniref:RICTOR_N domain-containing protein n=1 Tax=Gongylonema pulchrum TaxID=637853 RepID=A0A183DZ91_9BILA|nr:unnamed protein product [Gongylonema pulchrum]